jgi:large subunit ribosomal protein L6
MSRIGLRPVGIPKGVQVEVGSGVVRVRGPKGALEEAVAPFTSIEVAAGEARVSRVSDHKAAKAAHGLMRSLLQNMVVGVTNGFARSLEIVGVGYRCEVKGQRLSLSVGYSHPVVLPIPEGVEVRADSPTRMVVSGSDKQQVGQFAANIRRVRPPEPYNGKGIRYSDERIRRKVGKTAGG